MPFRRARFADVIERQLDLFEREHRDVIEEAEERLEAYNRAERDEAEELYGDYVDAVETGHRGARGHPRPLQADARRGRRRAVRARSSTARSRSGCRGSRSRSTCADRAVSGGRSGARPAARARTSASFATRRASGPSVSTCVDERRSRCGRPARSGRAPGSSGSPRTIARWAS